MSKSVHTTEEFSQLVYELLKSDRDVNLAIGGFTGVGKSTFATKLQKSYSQISGTHWDFGRMTWSLPEMMKWIDGEGDDKKGQLPEYSAILPDELFLMFFSRNWYDKEQIDAISVLNMCRDRHLFIAGNVPNFWELDSAFRERMRFYAFLPRRGVAWVFEQETNPFSKDPWNVVENKKFFRKYGNPYKCPNFIFEVHFDDWEEDEKKVYYSVRNEKRVEAVSDRKERRLDKDIGRRDLILGKSIILLKKYSGFSFNRLSLDLGVAPKTVYRYVSLAQSQESLESGYEDSEDE